MNFLDISFTKQQPTQPVETGREESEQTPLITRATSNTAAVRARVATSSFQTAPSFGSARNYGAIEISSNVNPPQSAVSKLTQASKNSTTVLEIADFNAKAADALARKDPDTVLSHYWKKAAEAATAAQMRTSMGYIYFVLAKNYYQQAAIARSQGKYAEAEEFATLGEIQTKIAAEIASPCTIS